MEEGVLPANLHYNTPNLEVAALIDGRLQVVNKNQPWNGGLVGVNSFGFGGSNAHLLLRSNTREVNPGHPASKHCRLVACSSRTEVGVQKVIQEVVHRPEDVEFQALIQDSMQSSCTSHPFRGFALINGSSEVSEVRVSYEERYTKMAILF